MWAMSTWKRHISKKGPSKEIYETKLSSTGAVPPRSLMRENRQPRGSLQAFRCLDFVCFCIFLYVFVCFLCFCMIAYGSFVWFCISLNDFPHFCKVDIILQRMVELTHIVHRILDELPPRENETGENSVQSKEVETSWQQISQYWWDFLCTTSVVLNRMVLHWSNCR